MVPRRAPHHPPCSATAKPPTTRNSAGLAARWSARPRSCSGGFRRPRGAVWRGAGPHEPGCAATTAAAGDRRGLQSAAVRAAAAAGTRREFGRALTQLRVSAGLSLRALENKLAEEKRWIRKSTLSRACSGESVFGSERYLVAFVRACGAGHELAPWIRAWRRARTFPGETHRRTARRGCRRCRRGCGDPRGHRAGHEPPPAAGPRTHGGRQRGLAQTSVLAVTSKAS